MDAWGVPSEYKNNQDCVSLERAWKDCVRRFGVWSISFSGLRPCYQPCTDEHAPSHQSLLQIAKDSTRNRT